MRVNARIYALGYGGSRGQLDPIFLTHSFPDSPQDVFPHCRVQYSAVCLC